MIKTLKNKIKNKIGSDFFDFLNHSKNYISASLFNQGLSVITVPIFTRLLVPADYGLLAILSSFISIFAIIYGLGIRGSITRYYYENKHDFGLFLGSNIIFIITWSLILSLLLFFLTDRLLLFFQIPKKLIYVGISIVFFQVFFQIYENYLQASKNSKKVAKLTITQRVITIILSIGLILLMTNEKYYGKAYSMLIVTAGMGAYSLYKLFNILTLKINFDHIKYALIFSLPVVFHLLSQYILSAFDKVIINQLIGAKETGLYSLAYTVGAFQNMIIMGMLRAWTPEFYDKLNNNKNNEINALASKFSKLVYISAFIIILFARELIIILADKSYHEALSIVPVVVISYVFFFLYTMYINYAFYAKKTKLIAFFTIIAGGVNIGLNYWLIPIYGYKMAAWTTLVSYACLFILHYCNVRFIIKPEWITQLRVLLPNFLVLIAFVVGFSFLDKLGMPIWLLLIVKIIMLFSMMGLFFGKQIYKKMS